MPRGNYWAYDFRSSDFNGTCRHDRGRTSEPARPTVAELEALDGRPCAQGPFCASSLVAEESGERTLF